MDVSLSLRIAIVVAAALLLGWVFLAYLRRDRTSMQHMLDAFLSVFGDPHVGRSPWGYQYVQGTLDGHPARVSLIPDALITRTLPTLWLELRWARQHDAWLCVVLDVNGMEYFAEDVDEGNRLVSPPGGRAGWLCAARTRGASGWHGACATSTSRSIRTSR